MNERYPGIPRRCIEDVEVPGRLRFRSTVREFGVRKVGKQTPTSEQIGGTGPLTAQLKVAINCHVVNGFKVRWLEWPWCEVRIT